MIGQRYLPIADHSVIGTHLAQISAAFSLDRNLG
jgi:hypothetical protein